VAGHRLEVIAFRGACFAVTWGDVAETYDVNRTEIDGVPVFWTNVEGPLTAALVFRVGRADEPAAIGGITHLVEHLALAPLSQQPYGHNGFVAAARTVFHVSGTDDQIVDFMARVCASLASLPLGRVGMERGILLQESASMGGSVSATLRHFRFGNVGHGLLGQPQFGLDWVGEGLVDDWAREMFGAGNAAVWMTGPPPNALRLPLPTGRRTPPPPLGTIDGLSLPAHVKWEGPGVAFSYLATRASAAVIALSILARRARDVLRFERGRVYDIGSEYDPVDARSAHCLVAANCQPEHAAEVLEELLRAVGDLRNERATTDEIKREASAFIDNALLPGAKASFLDMAATDELYGRRTETPDQIMDEYATLDPAAIRFTLDESADSLLVAAGLNPPADSALHEYPIWSLASVTGREHRNPGMPFGSSARKDRLIVGDDGVTYRDPHGNRVTVRFDQCVVYRHWKCVELGQWSGPIRDILGADGFGIRIVASNWNDGSRMVDRIDALVPPELVVCDVHGLGALRYPASGSPEARPAGD
jgi:zinc protease